MLRHLEIVVKLGEKYIMGAGNWGEKKNRINKTGLGRETKKKAATKQEKHKEPKRRCCCQDRPPGREKGKAKNKQEKKSNKKTKKKGGRDQIFSKHAVSRSGGGAVPSCLFSKFQKI